MNTSMYVTISERGHEFERQKRGLMGKGFEGEEMDL